jgi:hypothetical protein
VPRISAGGSGVSAEGLNRLNRDLKAIGKDAQAELKKANVDVAHREAARAQRAAYSVGGVAAHVAPGHHGRRRQRVGRHPARERPGCARR